MTNILIASFSDEAQAVEASHKLTELESYGDLTVYEMAMVRKNLDGKIEAIKTETRDGMGTLSGMTIGTLVGALAGPVGMLLGMFTGTLTGAAIESDFYNFSGDFGKDYADKMTPGTVAILAEVDEISSLFVDKALLPLGATITRSDLDYEYEKYQNSQLEALENEVEAERLKLKTAISEEKIRVQNRIADLKEQRRNKLKELEGRIKTVASDVNSDWTQLKIERLQRKIERYEHKLVELQDELQRTRKAA